MVPMHAALRGMQQAPGAMPPLDIHILLVDDERLSRVVVANLLRKCNYQVTVAESGGQALELLRQEPRQFHLLLTDVMMPQVGGIELLRYVRSHQELVDMPVIMMSASEQAETVTECIRGGAEEYLVKPVTQKEVQKIWTHVVKRNASSSGAGPGATPVGVLKALLPLAGPVLNGAAASQLPPSRPSANGHAQPAPQAAGSGVTPPAANGSAGPVAADSPQSRLTPAPGDSKPDGEKRAGSKRSSKRGALARNGASAQTGAGRVVSMSLRQWISRPGRSADTSKTAELLWILAETLLLVERWHVEHGTGCGRVRPSQLVLHSNGSVTWAPTAAQPAQRLQQQEAGGQQEKPQVLLLQAGPHVPAAQQQQEGVPVAEVAVGNADMAVDMPTHAADAKQQAAAMQVDSHAVVELPRRPSENGKVPHSDQGKRCAYNAVQRTAHEADGLHANNTHTGTASSDDIEEQLYRSPELTSGAKPTPLSDVFQLGLLFFELLHTVSGQDTLGVHWKDRLRDARDRHLPAALLQARMLHHEPSSRLSLSELQNQGILKRAVAAVRSRHAMQHTSSKQKKAATQEATQEANWQQQLDQVVLSDFLRMMYSRKRAELSAVESTIKALEQDMSLLEHVLAGRHAAAQRRRVDVGALMSPRLGASNLLQSSSSLPAPANGRLANGSSPATDLGRAASIAAAVQNGGMQPARTASVNTTGTTQQAAALVVRMNSRTCSCGTGPNCQGTCGKDTMEMDVQPSPKAVKVPNSPGVSRGAVSQGDFSKGLTVSVGKTGVCGLPAGAAPEDQQPLQVASNRWQSLAEQHAALQDLYLRVRAQAQDTGASPADVKGSKRPAVPPVPPAKRSRTGDVLDITPVRGSNPVPPVQAPKPAALEVLPAPVSDRSADLPSYMQQFCEDLSGYSRYTSLELLASMQQGDVLSSSHMVCSVAFDRDDEFFATAGVSRRIRIYELASVMRGAVVGSAYPVLDISTQSRLSNVCWSGYVKSHLAAADYDGMVALWDVNTHTELLQFEEHGKRVWAVDFSKSDPTRLASAADDSTIKLWTISQEHSTATINCGANVCSVQWNPHSPHLLACGTANCRALVYDVRNISEPLMCISDHTKAVSYVRHMSAPDQLLTASTDSAVRRWQMPQSIVQDVGITTGKRQNGTAAGFGAAGAAGLQANGGSPQAKTAGRGVEQPTCVMSYSGHTNVRNFVGLSVSKDGYIACGSEDNSLVCYYQALPFPSVVHRFTDPTTDVNDLHEQGVVGGASREQVAQSGGPPAFVSSVSWAQHSNLLLAANSLGVIHVLQLA